MGLLRSPVEQRTTAALFLGVCQRASFFSSSFSPMPRLLRTKTHTELSSPLPPFLSYVPYLEVNQPPPPTQRPLLAQNHATRHDASPAALLGQLGEHHGCHPLCLCCPTAPLPGSAAPPLFPSALSRCRCALVLLSTKGRSVNNRSGESGA